ncbi:unnamed protein product [Rotaria magnacalcarata]|uniref:Ras-GEF domain-containing protein n=3 Tax=Rotaria magnacalcarata TaxID=392030 RepID=A0A814LJZ0_9BILA|nr:unnamed protein product [Rotaria magnacalcarata]CAF1911459.1 unnamed protein product [Rotaria magnacalcarata]CAF4557718.1 unnamed protein product [Rotaria magnacalcarata]
MYSMKSKEIRRSRFLLKTDIKFDIHDIRRYQAVDIADELTLINQSLLLLITPVELFNFAFLSNEKKFLAPNITTMLEFYDRTVALFAAQILRQRTDKIRASIIIHLFSVVQHLYIKNHDIHSIRIILATFDHPSIFRLRNTWRIFRIQKPKFYTALKYLWNVLGQKNNWEDYHLWLEQKFIKDCLNKKQPMLLFIGYLLSKMIIDHYRYYTISSHSKTSTLSRVHMTLIDYVKSSPKNYQ